MAYRYMAYRSDNYAQNAPCWQLMVADGRAGLFVGYWAGQFDRMDRTVVVQGSDALARS